MISSLKHFLSDAFYLNAYFCVLNFIVNIDASEKVVSESTKIKKIVITTGKKYIS